MNLGDKANWSVFPESYVNVNIIARYPGCVFT